MPASRSSSAARAGDGVEHQPLPERHQVARVRHRVGGAQGRQHGDGRVAEAPPGLVVDPAQLRPPGGLQGQLVAGQRAAPVHELDVQRLRHARGQALQLVRVAVVRPRQGLHLQLGEP
jgi:hypothetical protein